MRLIEGKLNKTAVGIELEKARNMESITNHAQHPKMAKFGQAGSQAITSPSDEVVGQLTQKQEHLLSRERLLVAFMNTQTEFRPFDGGFHATTAQIISINSSPERVKREAKRALALLSQPVEGIIGQIKDQDSRMPLFHLFLGNGQPVDALAGHRQREPQPNRLGDVGLGGL